jgi:cytochrome b pre-mRNA-processing protein 3
MLAGMIGARLAPTRADIHAMLRFLFPRLTAEPERGVDLFAWVTEQARSPHWYLEGAVPDTIDGRFAMIATIAALLTLRLEQASDEGRGASVALTERFIEVMESEHREIGLGDPALGRTVRKLVGSLGRRVDLWRSASNGSDWNETTHRSVYGENAPSNNALNHTAGGLREIWSRLEAAPDAIVLEGRID